MQVLFNGSVIVNYTWECSCGAQGKGKGKGVPVDAMKAYMAEQR